MTNITRPFRKDSALLIGLLFLLFASTIFADVNPGTIDGHNHLFWQGGGRGGGDFNEIDAAEFALTTMNKTGIATMIILPPPFPQETRGSYDESPLLHAAKKFPGRFAVLAGGGTLNPLLQRAVKEDRVTTEDLARFKETATHLAESGVVGFGEIGLLHLALGPNHNYHAAPADHPLMLALADIAAEKGLPIDIHMEAVSDTMPLPARLAAQEVNPPLLKDTIAAFERLLSHNRRARIIWAHAGWDNTGLRTPGFMADLLTRHANLYMSIKISPQDSEPATAPIGPDGEIKKEWLELFYRFPDRFFIGTDQFYTASQKMHIGPQRTGIMADFNKKLPDDLRPAITHDNAARLFRLP